MSEDLTRAWLARYGAPLYGQSLVAGRAAPDLERVVSEALALSRRDPSVARALPVLFWLHRRDLDLRKLGRLAATRRHSRALGFFLDLTGHLSGDRGLRKAADPFRPTSSPRLTNFFTKHQGPLALALAEANTPPLARSWGYRMNMGMDVFESMFAKAKTARHEALLAS